MDDKTQRNTHRAGMHQLMAGRHVRLLGERVAAAATPAAAAAAATAAWELPRLGWRLWPPLPTQLLADEWSVKQPSSSELCAGLAARHRTSGCCCCCCWLWWQWRSDRRCMLRASSASLQEKSCSPSASLQQLVVVQSVGHALSLSPNNNLCYCCCCCSCLCSSASC
jgi:hypothetical protein